jgi:hypothetical protein
MDPFKQPEPAPESDKADKADKADKPSAAVMLREFEDKHLGPDVHRINGKVERGHGAPRYRLHLDLQARHIKLETLVDLENKRDDAKAKLDSAALHHEYAEKRLAEAHEALGKADEKLTDLKATRPLRAGEKFDGPTVEEFVKAGYSARAYPPDGYASRSTPEEIAAEVKKETEAEQKAADERKAEEKKLADAEAAKAKEKQPAEV